jgi:hypothetical protein
VRDSVIFETGSGYHWRTINHNFDNTADNTSRTVNARKVYHYAVPDSSLDENKQPPRNSDDYLNSLGDRDNSQYVRTEVLVSYRTTEGIGFHWQEKNWQPSSDSDPLLRDPLKEDEPTNDGPAGTDDANGDGGIDPPWRLDPLQNIVNVSWRGQQNFLLGGGDKPSETSGFACVSYSKTGSDWTNIIDIPGASNYITGLAYGKGVWVGLDNPNFTVTPQQPVTSNFILSKDKGKTWGIVRSVTSGTEAPDQIAYGNVKVDDDTTGIFVAVNTGRTTTDVTRGGNTIYTSTNGKDWDAATAPWSDSATSTSLTFVNGRFFIGVLSAPGDNRIAWYYVSTNGTKWQSGTAFSGTIESPHWVIPGNIAYSPEFKVYAAAGAIDDIGGSICTCSSSDGLSWSNGTMYGDFNVITGTLYARGFPNFTYNITWGKTNPGDQTDRSGMFLVPCIAVAQVEGSFVQPPRTQDGNLPPPIFTPDNTTRNDAGFLKSSNGDSFVFQKIFDGGLVTQPGGTILDNFHEVITVVTEHDIAVPTVANVIGWSPTQKLFLYVIDHTEDYAVPAITDDNQDPTGIYTQLYFTSKDGNSWSQVAKFTSGNINRFTQPAYILSIGFGPTPSASSTGTA